MTMIDPEIKKYMHQQRMQQWIGNLAQGLMNMGNSREGVIPGLLKAVGGASAGGSDPMDGIMMQMRMEQLSAGKEERAREAQKRAAQEAFLVGSPTQLASAAGPSEGMTGGFSGGVPPEEKAFAEAVGLDNYFAAKARQHFAAPKDPLLKDFKEGDRFVTKRFNRTTRKWEPTGSEGPRYKPGTNVNVEAADISGLSGLMTATQRGQEVAALKESRGQAVSMVDQGFSLVNSLREGGNQAVSWSGAMARGINTIASQGEAIAKNFGIQMGDGSISKTLNSNDWEWGELDEESSVIKSKILGLAVAITKADQGSRPSDFDVQTSIARIAGNSGNAATTAAVVEDLLNEKMRGFSHRYNLAAPDYELAPFNWDETLSTLGIERPAAPDPVAPETTLDDLELEMQSRGLLPGG